MHVPALLAAFVTAAAPAQDAGHAHHHGGDALMWHAGGWMIMAHGFVNAIHDEQNAGRRGDTKNFSNSMFMATGERELESGSLEVRSMVSLDPAMGKGGYPLLFQSGETANGRTHLIDRQHPHDFFMELGARYRRETEDGAWFAYAALPGEPALGPTAFMHRASGIRIPEAPMTHHWLDSTHITWGVVTLGIERGDFTFELSRFNGKEPDQYHWNIETGTLDSTSARITWRPAAGWTVQASYGDIRDPEITDPGQYNKRTTVSAIYEGTLYGRPWATTLAWGRNDRRRGLIPTHYHLPGVLLESTLEPFDGHAVFIRAERIWHDDAAIPLKFKKASVGYIVDVLKTGPVRWGVGGLISYLKPDPITTFFYTDRPDGWMAFLQARF